MLGGLAVAVAVAVAMNSNGYVLENKSDSLLPQEGEMEYIKFRINGLKHGIANDGD